MAITPDTKDWTWVLDRPCPECGYDRADFSRDGLARVIRANAATWQIELTRDDVRVRPSAECWSVLEYACHVRDVYRVFDGRITLMRSEDDPVFANWDQDETAVNDHYDAQDPAQVGVELTAAAETVADRFDSLLDDEWGRGATRSNGSVFTIETLGLYMVHDSIHHLWDVAY
ncbi:MAG: DinB family protein [Acidimicrobiales bacterium]|jgi:hypothetical protein